MSRSYDCLKCSIGGDFFKNALENGGRPCTWVHGIATDPSHTYVQAFAAKEGLFFMETSAKDNVNVAQAFEMAIHTVYSALRPKVATAPAGSEDDSPRIPAGGIKIPIGLPEEEVVPRRSSCCSA